MAMRGQLTNGDGYGKVVDVTASASPLADGPTDAIYLDAAGSVTVTMLGGQSVVFAGLAVGVVHRLRVTHVTAGAGVKALYW